MNEQIIGLLGEINDKVGGGNLDGVWYALAAIGTWVLAVIAIWGDSIKTVLFPVKLRIEGQNLESTRYIAPLKSTKSN